VNVTVGKGTLLMGVNDVSGVLNITACNAHAGVMQGALNFGTLNISGDPLLWDVAGPVSVPGSAPNANFTVLSGSDIQLDATGSVVTSGHNIVMVAGAKLIQSANMQTVKVAGPSTSGGSIVCLGCGSSSTFTLDASSTAPKQNGGNIKLFAFGSNTNNSGQISLS